MRIFLSLGVILVALVFASATRVDAHANLVRSEPAANAIVAVAPTRIILEYTERPDLGFSRVSIFNDKGEKLRESAMTSQGGSGETVSFEPGPLANGTYTVAWRAVSTVDGHETQGAFAFSVGEQTAAAPVEVDAFGTNLPPKWLSVFSRWLTFVGAVLIVGFAAFRSLVLWPSVIALDLQTSIPPRLRSFVRRSWWLALLLGAIAAVLALLMQSWRNAGGFGDGVSALGDVLADSRYGHIWLARIAVIGVLAELTVLFGNRFLAPRKGDVLPGFLVLSTALALPVTMSLNSHAAAGHDLTTLATIADWVHATGAGVWLGGLVMFAFVLRAGLADMDAQDRPRLLSVLIPRFSLVAIVSVGAIVLTGIFQWALQVGNLDDTVNSGFGQSLIAKTLLLAPMLLLGALHLTTVSAGIRNAVSQAGEALAAKAGPIERLFKQTLLLEAMLGVLLLVATGFLTDTSPPGRAASSAKAAFSSSLTIDDLDVKLTVNPAKPGNNVILATLTDKRGPKEALSNVEFRFTFLDQELGETQSKPETAGTDTFRLQGLQLSIPGRWRILILVQREGVDDVRATFEVPVGP